MKLPRSLRKEVKFYEAIGLDVHVLWLDKEKVRG